MPDLNQRGSLLIYVSLLLDVVLFFHKPLLSHDYIFPWDFRGVQLPLITFLSDELKRSHFALWNPFSYCGYPIFANIEACFFHPMVLASAFISSRTSLDALPKLLEWTVVLQVWGAGIATYYLFRELGVGRASAWTGAVIFQTGGYFASRAEHIHSMMAVAWMPLAWLAVLKLRLDRPLQWLAILGAALGMAILGGFPQPTLAVFVSTAVLSIVLVALRLAPIRTVAYAAVGCVLGIALAAIQFLPTTQLSQHSVAKYRGEWLGTGGGLHWGSLITLVSPNHFNIFDMSKFHGPGDPTFLYLYVSLGGLLLAVVAVALRRQEHVPLLAVMTLFGLLWMLGDKTVLWKLFYPFLPEKVRIGIHPEYTYCIVTLGLAGLAAMGLESLRLKEAIRWVAGLVIAADLFLVGSGRPMNTASLKDEPGVTRKAFDGNERVLQELRHYVNQTSPPWRVDTMSDANINWSIDAPITQVPIANGVSPLALENIIQLRLFLHDGFRGGWYYPVEKPESSVLDLMNVKYLIATEKSAERLRALPRYRYVASLPGVELFENFSVMPRFFLVDSVMQVASMADARNLIERGEIDFRRTAITEEAIPVAGGSANATGDIKVLDYQPASLELSVQSAGNSLLVMSENYYPGWKAWLDGKQVPIYRTDIAFRGVAVPAGNHRVQMRFEPVILKVSIAITLMTALLLIGLVILGKKREP